MDVMWAFSGDVAVGAVASEDVKDFDAHFGQISSDQWNSTPVCQVGLTRISNAAEGSRRIYMGFCMPALRQRLCTGPVTDLFDVPMTAPILLTTKKVASWLPVYM